MLLALLLASARAAEPSAPGLVVWTSPEVPAEAARARADRLAGGAVAHRAWPDVAWAPTPWAPADQARADALTAAVTSARTRWDVFDVEAGIARDLDAAAEDVVVLRDDADRARLVDALLLEGAAVLRLAPPSAFATAEAVAPFRRPLDGQAAPAPLLDVLALEPDRVWTRDDVPDLATLQHLDALAPAVDRLPPATLSLSPLPAGAAWVVDGRRVAGTTVAVPPGHHYVHVLLGDVLHGRIEVDLASGAAQAIEPFVSRAELDTAAAAVKAGTRDVPPDVATAVQGLARASTPPARTFLATLDEQGKPVVVAYANGAAVKRVKPVTVLLSGDVGGGVLISPAFAGRRRETVLAPAFGGTLGAEVGIYNAALFGRVDLALTPTEQVNFLANEDDTENTATNAHVRPYGGVGVYLPRPQAGIPLFFLGGSYGWMSPGSRGFGATVSIGIPLKGEAAWTRFTLDGYRGVQMAGFPAEGEAAWYGALRVGFGRAL